MAIKIKEMPIRLGVGAVLLDFICIIDGIVRYALRADMLLVSNEWSSSRNDFYGTTTIAYLVFTEPISGNTSDEIRWFRSWT